MQLFETLKLYTVHVKKNDMGEIEDVRFVKEGFNWWAFLFNPIWALLNRCWLLAVLGVAFWVVTQLVGKTGWMDLSYGGMSMIQIAAFAIIGVLANDELRESLGARGYEQVDVVSGLSKMRAVQRYYDRMDGHVYS